MGLEKLHLPIPCLATFKNYNSSIIPKKIVADVNEVNLKILKEMVKDIKDYEILDNFGIVFDGVDIIRFNPNSAFFLFH